ncbi:fascin domain-containing protein [Anaerocolumna xylanovorans]|uniref:Fascin-like domain-containing protein n=1 Tax=Anaerocolumna xylanovorans DSM 12503 TaxID=1121345 RepID=A0A1M7YNN7_9FIRM|nr:hypothetical protein [Anaerocolumna xylanovorans]SHO54205.1 hypothetical protein SAMN02745217_04661 [Anaerocolumna xylanovorans DSM 12503]
MEATWDPVDLPNPADYKWENVMYEYHNYLYDDYDNAQGKQIANMETKVNAIAAADYNVLGYMGEFNYFNNMDAWGKAGDSAENRPLTHVVTKYAVMPARGNSLGLKTVDFSEGDYSLKGLHTNLFVSVQEDGSLLAKDAAAKNYFHIIKGKNGTILLRAEDKTYVTVDKTTKKLKTGGKTEKDADKFTVTEMSDSLYAIRSSVTGKFVCADENLAGVPLIADRDSPSSWESFYITAK